MRGFLQLKDKLLSKFKVERREADEEGAPIFVMVGSMRDCTRRDVVAFARGLAEQYVTAPSLGRYNVQEDRENRRFIFEIHEGGPERSIIDAVMEALAAGEEVGIALASGGYVAVHDELGEVFSLVHPATARVELSTNSESKLTVKSISAFCGKKQLTELFPENKKLPIVGAIGLAISISLFLISGAAYTFARTGVFEVDTLLAAAKAGHVHESLDNPVWQLSRARLEAERSKAKGVTVLKRSGGKWTWELAK